MGDGAREAGRELDARQRGTLLEDCLHTLLMLLAHLPRPAGREHQLAAIRSTMTHLLLLKPRTFSELADAAIGIEEESPSMQLLQEAIEEVSVQQPGGSGGLYSLRESLATRDYSLAFPNLTRTDHQVALEQILTALRRARYGTSCGERSCPGSMPPAYHLRDGHMPCPCQIQPDCI